MKMGPKNQKTIERRFSVLPVFVSGPFIPLVSRLGQSDSSMCWNMLKCNQRHEACKVLAQSPEPVRPQPSSLNIKMKALIVLFCESFVGLEQFRRYCGLKFKHQILGWIRKCAGPFRVNLFFQSLSVFWVLNSVLEPVIDQNECVFQEFRFPVSSFVQKRKCFCFSTGVINT